MAQQSTFYATITRTQTLSVEMPLAEAAKLLGQSSARLKTLIDEMEEIDITDDFQTYVIQSADMDDDDLEFDEVSWG